MDLYKATDEILENSNNKRNSSILINDSEMVVVYDELECDFLKKNKEYVLLTKFDKFNLNKDDIFENLSLWVKNYKKYNI